MKRYAWAVLAALLVALAFPPFYLWPLSFVGFAVFCRPLVSSTLAASPFPTVQAERRFFALWFFTYSLAVNIFGFYWLAYTLREFGEMPYLASAPLALIIFAGLSVLSALFGALWPFLRRWARGPLLGMAAVVAWLVLWDTLDLRLFPWTPAMAVGTDKFLLASVNVLHTSGWRLVFFALSTLLSFFWLRPFTRPRKLGLSLALFCGFFLPLYALGVLTLHRLEREYPARQPVALLQGNVGNYQKKLVKKRVFPTVQNVLQIHGELIDQIVAHEKENPTTAETWTFWPETSFPSFPLTDRFAESVLLSWVAKTGGLHVVGAYENAPVKFGDRTERLDINTIFLYHERQGFLARYRKNIRVPFGEYVPGDEYYPDIYRQLPTVPHFGRGYELEGLPHPDPTGPVFMPLVCYEILYDSFRAGFLRELEKKYPGRQIIMVNPSNDSWYGPTSEPFQNALLARWAAASLGVSTLRPTNTGISEVIAPWGEELATTDRDEARVVFGLLPVKKTQDRLH